MSNFVIYYDGSSISNYIVGITDIVPYDRRSEFDIFAVIVELVAVCDKIRRELIRRERNLSVRNGRR